MNVREALCESGCRHWLPFRAVPKPAGRVEPTAHPGAVPKPAIGTSGRAGLPKKPLLWLGYGSPLGHSRLTRLNSERPTYLKVKLHVRTAEEAQAQLGRY